MMHDYSHHVKHHLVTMTTGLAQVSTPHSYCEKCKNVDVLTMKHLTDDISLLTNRKCFLKFLSSYERPLHNKSLSCFSCPAVSAVIHMMCSCQTFINVSYKPYTSRVTDESQT